MLPLLGFAQYYNPYGSYQQQRQSNQNAYNAGAEAMKQIMEQQRQTNQNTYNAGAEAMKQIMEQQQQTNQNAYNFGAGGLSGGYSNGHSSSRRTCPGCNGTGKGADQITYAPEFTGNSPSVYCSICGRTTSRHSHHQPTCRTCYGRGYVE